MMSTQRNSPRSASQRRTPPARRPRPRPASALQSPRDRTLPGMDGPGQAGWDAIVAAPERALVALDYDGVLAPIVDDPDQAVPAPGAIETLRRLAGRVGTLAVVTGRPARWSSGSAASTRCPACASRGSTARSTGWAGG